ncbi:hypothetical protein DFJ74DRAFT_71906 [Hyaloraphidium curvatum]|nr:hypothetical protein DFJ74DRAFT_71906 [Hyaloraphidium curvatum]
MREHCVPSHPEAGTAAPSDPTTTIADHETVSARIRDLALQGQAPHAAPNSRPGTGDGRRRRRSSSLADWASTGRRRDSRMAQNSNMQWRKERARDRWHSAFNRIVSFGRWNAFDITVRLPADLKVASGADESTRINLEEFRSRGSLPASVASTLCKPPKERAANEIAALAIFGSTLKGLQGFGEQERAKMLALGRFDAFGPGRLVVREGRPAENAFLVLNGTVAEFSDASLPFVAKQYKTGDWFGEESAPEAPRTASVLTVENTQLLSLPLAVYAQIMLKTTSAPRGTALSIFDTFRSDAADELQAQLHARHFAVNERVVVEGTPRTGDVYVVVEGSAFLTKMVASRTLILGKVHKGQAFGFLGGLESSAAPPESKLCNPANMVAGEHAIVLAIPRDVFLRLASEATWQYMVPCPPLDDSVAENAVRDLWTGFKSGILR